MDMAKGQNEKGYRRRSMLPQRAGLKASSKPLLNPSERAGVETEQQSITLEKPQSSTSNDADNDHIKTQPPGTVGRSRSVRDSSKDQTAKSQSGPSITRKPSGGRPLSQRISVTPAQTRITSHSATIRTKAPLHGRSVSQQLEKKAALGFSSLRKPSLRQSSMNSQKPVFSTMQQHFTPKKATKSRPSSPSSQPSTKDVMPSAAVFHLQMELAQLHLLHRSAASVQNHWQRSAQDFFQHRSNSLYERHVELKEIAHQQQILMNQLALVNWSQGKTGTQIAEKVQLLSHNISDVCNLLGAEGKYTRILEIFESWFTQALDIRGRREVKTAKTGKNLDFNESIGDGWKAEAMVVERELTYCLRDLKDFGLVRHNSSLGRIILLYSKLVGSLLEELDVIQWIENEIMIQEISWVEKTVHNLASNVSGDIGTIGPIQSNY